MASTASRAMCNEQFGPCILGRRLGFGAEEIRMARKASIYIMYDTYLRIAAHADDNIYSAYATPAYAASK